MQEGGSNKVVKVAVLLAVCAVLVSLVYTRLPSFPSAIGTATSTPTESLESSSPPVVTTTNAAPYRPTVTIGGQTIRVDIAATNAARVQGLSGRAGLASDEGMLFAFPEDGTYAFWMKDMRFSVDIVWLSVYGEVGEVVDFRQNVSPDTYPTAFTSRAPARYVLELPAGFIKEHAVKIGDHVSL